MGLNSQIEVTDLKKINLAAKNYIKVDQLRAGKSIKDLDLNFKYTNSVIEIRPSSLSIVGSRIEIPATSYNFLTKELKGEIEYKNSEIEGTEYEYNVFAKQIKEKQDD